MSIIKQVTLQKIVAHDFRYDPRIYVKLDICVFFENLWRKFKLPLNVIGIKGTLQKDICTSLISCRSVLIRMRNDLDKSCRENKNTLLWLITFLKSCSL